MAVVTVIVKRMRANVPGRWVPDMWFYGIDKPWVTPSRPIEVNIATDFSNVGDALSETRRVIQEMRFAATLSLRDVKRLHDLSGS